MLSDAYQDKYDKYFLMSSDSDFIPLLEKINNDFQKPRKKVGIITPPYSNGSNGTALKPMSGLKECAYMSEKSGRMIINLTFDRLNSMSFPQQVVTPENKTITIPGRYQIF